MNFFGYDISLFGLYVVLCFWLPVIVAILWMVAFIACQIRQTLERRYNERQELLTRLANEALRVSGRQEEEAFCRKIKSHRPRLSKDEKRSLMRYVNYFVDTPTGPWLST